MSEGFSTTSTGGSTYPPAPSESHPTDFGVNTGSVNTGSVNTGSVSTGSVSTGSGITGSGAESSTTGAAKEQAGQVAQTAKHAGADVAGTVKEQAGAVTAEAGQQARNLLHQTTNEISEQAATQQQRVAGGLHSLADELQGLVNGEPSQGIASDVARMASDKAHEIADWLDRRDPAGLLDEVRSYARRRPGAYLAIALGAGILAGRLTKGLTGDSGGQQSGRQQVGGTGQSALPGDDGYAGTAGSGYTGTTGYAATPGHTGTTGYETGYGTTGSAASGYGQDDALLTAGDVPAVQAIPPVEGYGTSGGTRGDLTR